MAPNNLYNMNKIKIEINKKNKRVPCFFFFLINIQIWQITKGSSKLASLLINWNFMPRGKNTVVEMICQKCKGRFIILRINKKNLEGGKLELKKFCKACGEQTEHKSGGEVRHSK